MMTTVGEDHKYTMRISRLTIDKLGIQMYDRVSAVLAELIANCYDADAEHVEVTLPFGRYLAQKEGNVVKDLGYEIKIKDNGSGMTADEVNKYYLNVGFNRRIDRSEVTPGYSRRVMGRKGIGKLAPFGICLEVEVLSAGGEPNAEGYLVANLILELGEMLQDRTDKDGRPTPYHPKPGPLDGSRSAETGTTIILRRFDRRRVPAKDDLHRQLAARFGLSRDDWNVTILDSIGESDPVRLGALQLDLMDGTRISVDNRPVKMAEGDHRPVSGWVAYAKDPYKDEVMAGVRLYARGKIVGQTRDFDVKTGFTGEFKMRSYLTGEIHAEWLDADEDLVRTDRQDIIWNSEYGDAFREWGRELLKELAAKAETSAGQRVWDLFLEKSQLREKLERAHPKDAAIRDAIMRTAKSLVTRADRDSIENPVFVERVTGLAYAAGPHRTLLSTLDEVASSTSDAIEIILNLFERARVVEVYSLGQVAQERVAAIEQLRRYVADPATPEDQLQKLVENAPWILYPDWTPLSFNEPLARTRKNFESWYKANYDKEIVTSAIDNPMKKPDFVMLNHEGHLEIVEIKRPGHALTDEEFQRAFGYLTAVKKFIADTSEVRMLFPDVRLTIVCDSLNLRPEYATLVETDPNITHRTWHDRLQATTRAHEDFLKVVKEMQGELPKLPEDNA